MSTDKQLARLNRSLNVMADAMYMAQKRAGEAAEAAELVDAALHDVLHQIYWKLHESYNILDELLAEQQNPPSAP